MPVDIGVEEGDPLAASSLQVAGSAANTTQL